MIIDFPLIEDVISLFDNEIFVIAGRGGKVDILKFKLGIGWDLIKGKFLKLWIIIDLILNLLDELEVKRSIGLISNKEAFILDIFNAGPCLIRIESRVPNLLKNII